VADEYVVNTVRSYSSGTVGRSLNAVRNHHFVIDGPSIGEEIGSADAFLSGISSCGVNLIEVLARDTGVPLRHTDVMIAGVRSRQDTSVFARIDLAFVFQGPTAEQAESLVASYKKR
jgi:uncharacterized OsmC-like protein